LALENFPKKTPKPTNNSLILELFLKTGTNGYQEKSNTHPTIITNRCES
jgi:hypothetical protein